LLFAVILINNDARREDQFNQALNGTEPSRETQGLTCLFFNYLNFLSMPGDISISKHKVKILRQKYPDGIDNDTLVYAWANTSNFFAWWDLDAFKDDMWELLKDALTNDETESSGTDRSNRIFLYENLVKLVEVTELLFIHKALQQKKKPKKKKKTTAPADSSQKNK
jgi:hypothetical protein